MNQKLQDMLMQCYSHYAVEQVDYEKFAQLIINDVLAIIANPVNYNKYIYTTHDSSQAVGITTEIIKKIQEHFKVQQ